MKSYIKEKKYRAIPVGYIGVDDGTPTISTLLDCGDQGSSLDFYGINRNDTNCGTGAFDNLENDYRDLSIPSYFSQACCENVLSNATLRFGELRADVFSGQITNGWFNKRRAGSGKDGVSFLYRSLLTLHRLNRLQQRPSLTRTEVFFVLTTTCQL